MFERFTREARAAVMQAVEHASRARAAQIETEHLLLGVCRGDSLAARVLAGAGANEQALAEAVTRLDDARLLGTLGIDMEEIRASVERTFGPGAWTNEGFGPACRSRPQGGHIPFTAEAKKALELSLREALALKSGRIEAGHILLGLLRTGGRATEASGFSAWTPPRCGRSSSRPCARRGRLRRVYDLFKLLHVLAAVVWIGGSFVVNVISRRIAGSNDPARILAFGDDTEFVSRRIFAPASGLLFVTGVATVLAQSPELFKTVWVILGVVGWIALAVIGTGLINPLSKRLNGTIAEAGPAHPDVGRINQRIARLVRLELVLFVLLIADMVFKPAF
jgi:uncharacterized membrane protein